MRDLVSIADHGLLGSEYYWDNRERLNITEEELHVVGVDGRVQVHKDLIGPLQKADKAFQAKGMRIYIREGYRPDALYELAFRKRKDKFGEEDTRRIMNMEDRPHASGRSVDIVPWDPKENKEIPARKREDGVPAMFMDFYKERTDEEGKQYQELQNFMIETMLANGFQIGKRHEYFHFNYGAA